MKMWPFFKINSLVFFLASKDELTQIVKEEMDRNSSLSRDLQAIRSATNTIESVQTEKLQEKVCSLKINNFLSRKSFIDFCTFFRS